MKFHEGQAFTADDVVFSVERALASPVADEVLAARRADGQKKVDNLTVDLVHERAEPGAPGNHLFQFRIASKEWAAKNKSEIPQNYKDREDTYSSRNTNGTGPFKLVDAAPAGCENGALVRLCRLVEQAGSPEKGNLTQVDLLPVKSNATRAAALLSGEVDFVLDPRRRISPG